MLLLWESQTLVQPLEPVMVSQGIQLGIYPEQCHPVSPLLVTLLESIDRRIHLSQAGQYHRDIIGRDVSLPLDRVQLVQDLASACKPA